MTTRSWLGGNGNWITAENWSPSGAPRAGDFLTVKSGKPKLTTDGENGYDCYDDEEVTLESGAGLEIAGANLGQFFVVRTRGDATLSFTGSECVNGVILVGGNSRTTVDIAGPTGGSDALVLQTGSEIDAVGTEDAGSTIRFSGTVVLESRYRLALKSPVVNAGALTAVGTSVEFGQLSGSGTFTLQTGATLTIDAACASGQTIRFGEVGGDLRIADVADFGGAIEGFAPGDLIDLTGVAGSRVAYDAGAGTATVYDAQNRSVATLNHLRAAAGTLTATSDGAGGTLIGFSGGPSRLTSAIGMGARAMRADVVHGMSAPNGSAHLTGSGIKIGIISDSFFRNGSRTDTPDADAAAGLLPAKPDGTCAVHVLNDRVESGEDEGRAMAELIHQVAPDADLYFSDMGDSLAGMGASVTALKNAGCNIIVDDIYYYAEPDYQTGSDLDKAIESAIAAGVNYFTSASNNGPYFYEGTFQPALARVGDSTLWANTFGNGSAYLPIRYPHAGQILKLTWTAPWKGEDGTGAPEDLRFEIVDASGRVLASSQQLDDGGVKVACEALQVPSSPRVPTNANIVVYAPGGRSLPEDLTFKVTVLNGALGIEDPAAGTGSGSSFGHNLLARVNTVAAMPAAGSDIYAHQKGYAEPFSSYGPDKIVYDEAGEPLASPHSAGKPDFTAPDGIMTSVAGFTPFYGTSAAAPNAAAVAALMLQANPSLTTSQVTALLKSSAVPLEGASIRQQGAGLVRADRAVAAAESPVTVRGSGTGSYDGTAAVLVDGDLTLTGAGGGTISGATVAITEGFQDGDVLNVADRDGITAHFDGGVLTLTGTASAEAYQAALRSVNFASVSPDPIAQGRDPFRLIDIAVTDALNLSGGTTSTIALTGSGGALSADRLASFLAAGRGADGTALFTPAPEAPEISPETWPETWPASDPWRGGDEEVGSLAAGHAGFANAVDLIEGRAASPAGWHDQGSSAAGLLNGTRGAGAEPPIAAPASWLPQGPGLGAFAASEADLLEAWGFSPAVLAQAIGVAHPA
ncbi:S8 family serine peptidase [Methylobacterium sp. JK268]